MSVIHSAQLERGYRRLLVLYPKAFRREHEQELLSVLMAGAAEGQRRPGVAESFDLVRHAIFMRLRHTRVPTSWEYRHARVMGPLRLGIGLWLLLLTGILYGVWARGVVGDASRPGRGSALLHRLSPLTSSRELARRRHGRPASARPQRGRYALSTVVLMGACGVLLASCGGGGKTAAAGPACRTTTASLAGSKVASGAWPYANADLANTRVAPHSTISSADVSRLKPAWTFKLTGKAAAGVGGSGSLAAAPIVQGGVVYLQDLDSNVYALALATGKLEWEYRCNAPERSGPGPNGVAVADGTVYGETPTSVFALRAATGAPAWVNAHVLNTGEGTFGIQPQVADGRVYLASQYGSGAGGGVLLALNAATGAALWRFNTVRGQSVGVRSLGLGAGGAWETPLVGVDGSVTYGTGNPYQTPASAIAHPSAQLYTNSAVNLDAATGKLRWYYQGVPNDFKDYDMQASPIAARTGRVPVVIGAGKMGYVYEMNKTTLFFSRIQDRA